MKPFLVLLSFLFAAAVVSAQTPAGPEGVPDLKILKYGWSKERINWQQDPFSAPLEGYDDMRRRVSRERRRGGSILEERADRADETAKTRPPAPPRYAFNYKVMVQNSGPKTIKEIDWDYVFTDATTGEELGRREFTHTVKIAPNKRKELSVLVSSPPTKRISVYTLGKEERDGLIEKVVVLRILYEDGTIWQVN